MNQLSLGSKYMLEGELLKVFKYPSPILKKMAKQVEVFNEDLTLLAKNMLFTMYKAPGIGLAAPQTGHSIRMFCMDTKFERERYTSSSGDDSIRYSNFEPKIIINPRIVEKKGEIVCQEGCLSFPGIFEDVKRANSIIVSYQNLSSEIVEEELHDMESVCFQHELDHLDGIVFIERLSQLKRSMLLKKFSKKKKKRGING